MAPVPFIVLEAALLVLAHAIGGPPWTAVAAVACVALGIHRRRPVDIAAAFPALAWAAAARAGGNRELYFPFAMHLAVAAAASPRVPAAAAAGAAVVVAFLVVRWLQAATAGVLAVEAAAAAVVLAAAVAARSRLPTEAGRWAAPVAAALAALACLAL